MSKVTSAMLVDCLPWIRKLSRSKYPSEFADDIEQEACAMALEAKSYDAERGSLLKWLRFIVGMAAHRIRKREIKHSHDELKLENEPLVGGGQDEMCDANTAMRLVSSLPDPTPQIFKMHVAGHNLSECGSAHGMSKQGAHKHVKIARAAISKLAA